MVATSKAHARKVKLTSKQEAFALYLFEGRAAADAWRLAYNHPNAKDKSAWEAGSRVAANAAVQARIVELRAKNVGGVLLSVNDRLGKLSAAMNYVPKTSSDRQALARLVDVYTKIAGGGAPLQIAVSGKDGGPIEVTATVSVTRAPVRARLAALRAAREARG